jgi:threonine dehydrogenase-like Zn-dependent dehydrogenase
MPASNGRCYLREDVSARAVPRRGVRGPDACIDAVGLEAHTPGLANVYDRARQALTHRMNLEDAPSAYDTFVNNEDECVKVVLKP